MRKSSRTRTSVLREPGEQRSVGAVGARDGELVEADVARACRARGSRCGTPPARARRRGRTSRRRSRRWRSRSAWRAPTGTTRGCARRPCRGRGRARTSTSSRHALVRELGVLEAPREAPVLAVGPLALDQQPELLLEGQPVAGRRRRAARAGRRPSRAASGQRSFWIVCFVNHDLLSFLVEVVTASDVLVVQRRAAAPRSASGRARARAPA